MPELLSSVTGAVLERAFEYWRNVDGDIGKRIESQVRSGSTEEGVDGMGESTSEDRRKRAG